MTELEKWWDEIEDKIYEAQLEEIFDKFGAVESNLGWGVTGDDEWISVSTKVYCTGRHQVLTTEAKFPSFEFTHQWRDY